jgi:hypothetical protein
MQPPWQMWAGEPRSSHVELCVHHFTACFLWHCLFCSMGLCVTFAEVGASLLLLLLPLHCPCVQVLAVPCP